MMVKKYIALFAVIMMCNVTLHSSGGDGLQQGEQSLQLGDSLSRQTSLGTISRNSSSDSLSLTSSSRQSNSQLTAEAKVALNHAFPNAEAVLARPHINPDRYVQAVRADLAAVGETYKLGEMTEIQETVKKTVDAIKKDPITKNNPQKLRQALSLITKGVKAVLLVPTLAAVGVGVGASLGALRGIGAGGYVGSIAGYRNGNIFADQANKRPSMIRTAKSLANGLSRTLVGVVSAGTCAAVAGVGLTIAGTVGGGAVGGVIGADLAINKGKITKQAIKNEKKQRETSRKASSSSSQTKSNMYRPRSVVRK